MNRIKRNEDEVDESYKRRIWFIKHVKTKDAELLSNIWVNSLLLGCVYPLKIMNEIKKLLKNNINK